MTDNIRIYITSDHHGEYDRLFKILDEYEIKDCILLFGGDGAEGFSSREKQIKTFELLNNRFKKRNIQYKAIRGNHSDKSYFDGSINLSHFELIPDYTYKTINNLSFLFVGGAISVDRIYRREGVSYWKDEVFVLKPELIKPCDVLITHSAPSWIGPTSKINIEHWCQKDRTLWEECQHERQLHNQLFELAKPKYSYSGHFHSSYRAENNGCRARILDILEIVEFIHY